jgi:hypothetical protein
VATLYNIFVDPFQTDSFLRAQFVSASTDTGCDYVSRTGTKLVNVQLSLRGVRDLYANALRLALAISRSPSVEAACLVANMERFSPTRLSKEWQEIRGIFQPDVGRRMQLVAVVSGILVVEPEDRIWHGIGIAFQSSLPTDGQQRFSLQRGISPFLPRLLPRTPTRTYLEITKVLLCRWLKNEGPISIGKLANQVGCSSPPATQTVARLENLGVLSRHRNRAVELTGFSQHLWSELIALAGGNRPAMYFVDPTNQERISTNLLHRLLRLKPKNVALGGVLAAPFWDPAFDLNGMPRLDLEVHAPKWILDIDFVRTLDPALTPVSASQGAASVLVIHPVTRAEPLFDKGADHEIPYADPLETVFDLHELRLDSQANALIARMRPGARFL